MTQQTAPAVPDYWPSESKLIADLIATFPGISARPARDFGSPIYTHGAWVGGETRLLDGQQIFSTFIGSDLDIYDGNVHNGFIEWLSRRGWLIEEYDAGIFMVTSKAQAADDEVKDVAFQDLLDQRNAAQLVLSGLEVQVALERAQRARLWGDSEEEARCLVEAQERRQLIAWLRSVRSTYIGLKRDDPANDLPF